MARNSPRRLVRSAGERGGWAARGAGRSGLPTPDPKQRKHLKEKLKESEDWRCRGRGLGRCH